MSRWLVAPLICIACASQQDTSALKEIASTAVPAVTREAFATRPLDSGATINGMSFYHGRDSAHWVIATTANTIAIIDASRGAPIRTVGGAGTGMGEVRGPFGVVVLGDSIALVVERDNGRVQGFHLPDFTSVGTFGERILERPAAITAHLAGNAYAVYVTDNLASGAARVVQYRLTVGNGELIAIHWRTFGDTAGTGALHSSEAIAVDAERNRLLIVDHAPGGSSIKVYDVDGRFSGRTLAASTAAIGGVALYACGKTGGYWVATVRDGAADAFHVFDRVSLTRVGKYANAIGRIVRTFAVSGHAYGRFPQGAVFSTHQDGSLAATSWRDIATALQLRGECTTR